MISDGHERFAAIVMTQMLESILRTGHAAVLQFCD
jgi:hypothetical protein